MNTQKSEMEKIEEINILIYEYDSNLGEDYNSPRTKMIQDRIFPSLEKMLPKFNGSITEKHENCKILYQSFNSLSKDINSLVRNLKDKEEKIDVLINNYFKDKKGTSLVEGYINIEQLKQEVKEEIINELKHILTHNTISIEQQKNIISVIVVNELSNNNQEVNDEKIKITLNETMAESKINLSDEDKQKLIDEMKEKLIDEKKKKLDNKKESNKFFKFFKEKPNELKGRLQQYFQQSKEKKNKKSELQEKTHITDEKKKKLKLLNRVI